MMKRIHYGYAAKRNKATQGPWRSEVNPLKDFIQLSEMYISSAIHTQISTFHRLFSSSCVTHTNISPSNIPFLTYVYIYITPCRIPARHPSKPKENIPKKIYRTSQSQVSWCSQNRRCCLSAFSLDFGC